MKQPWKLGNVHDRLYCRSNKKLFYLKVIAAVFMQKNKQWSSRDSLCFTKM